MRQLPLLALVLGLAFASSPAAQWRWEVVDSVGMRWQVVERLERLPLRLGPGNLYQRARMQPQDRGDLIRGSYNWYCEILEFRKTDPEGGEDEFDDPSLTDEQREILAKLKEFMGASTHRDFKSWLDAQGDAEITVKGRKRKGSGTVKPDYEEWHWLQRGAGVPGPAGLWYSAAAVYDFEDRQVALVVGMPLMRGKDKKPSGKWNTFVKRMIGSGRFVEIDEEEEDSVRDKYADTDAKKEALAAAKANIASLKGWDYFTSPNYIVLYSWDFKDPADRVKSKRSARFYSSRLEEMRELYLEHYPLGEDGLRGPPVDPLTLPNPDGPTTGVAKAEPVETSAPDGDSEGVETDVSGTDDLEVQKAPPYPVFRLCATYDQFGKYGNSPRGVVGWFSPISKELVVFLGGDKMMGKGATETVTYHEGWHQFADLYFSHPDGDDAELHRWFDEGHGDYFGSFRRAGGRWVYKGSDMRYRSVKNMVDVGDYVPFKDLVTWNKRRFYSGRAAYYYAQAYSMIDYFKRGEKLGKYWKPEYGKVLDMYRQAMLAFHDQDRAVRTAFLEWKDEDWAALEEAWKAWVDSRHFKDG